MARTLVASDGFNSGSALSGNWAQLNVALAGEVRIAGATDAVGQFGVQSGDQKGTARWVGAGSFGDDQYAKLVVRNLPPSLNYGSTNAMGVCCRASADTGSAKDLYEAVVYSVAAGTTVLQKWLNGTLTTLATTSVTWAANDSIELEVVGTAPAVLTVYKNGVAISGLTYSDSSSPLTGGAPGIIASAGNMLGDAWEAGTVSTPSDFSGTATFSGMDASGVWASGASDFSGTATIADMGASGTFGAPIGTLTSPVFKNWSGTIQASVTIPKVAVIRVSDMAQVLTLTSQVTSGGGILSITNAALVPGVQYLVVTCNADGSAFGCEPMTAA